MISLPEFSSNTNPKLTRDRGVFIFLWCNVDRKHLMRFQSEKTPFSIFSGPAVDGAFNCMLSHHGIFLKRNETSY